MNILKSKLMFFLLITFLYSCKNDFLEYSSEEIYKLVKVRPITIIEDDNGDFKSFKYLDRKLREDEKVKVKARLTESDINYFLDKEGDIYFLEYDICKFNCEYATFDFIFNN